MNIQFDNISRNLMVLDIETVSSFSQYEDMDERLQRLWDKKASYMPQADQATPGELYYNRGAIFAEFGKIICISVGVFTKTADGEHGIRIKSFASDNEGEILKDLKILIESKFDHKSMKMVAHNGKEFDFPYICRRMLVHGIEIPEALDLRGKKPWEIQHIDTMELWKFGDRKNFTSLDLLAALFGIPSPKNDIDGSQVNDVYYKENDLARISKYCQRDVMVTAQVFLRLNGFPIIADNQINYL